MHGVVRVSERPHQGERARPAEGPDGIIKLADDFLATAFVSLQDKDAMTGAIRGALNGVRGAIDEACERLPASEEEQRQLARRCLNGAAAAAASASGGPMPADAHALVFDADEFDPSNPEAVVTGRQPTPADLGRIGDEFGVAVGDVTEEDIASAMGVVRTILLDLQEQLLDLSDDDVKELAEVSLVVARMALFYAKNLNDTLASNFGVDLASRAAARRPAAPVDGPESGVPISEESRRRQLLWAPLGPRLWSKAQELAAEGQKRPAAAVAVIACTMPFAWIFLLVGPPILIGDAALHWGVTTTPGAVVATAAGDALQVGRLWFLVGKLSTRQTYRFARREFQRVGGVPGVLRCSLDAASAVAADPLGSAKAGYRCVSSATAAAWERLMWLKDVATAARMQEPSPMG